MSCHVTKIVQRGNRTSVRLGIPLDDNPGNIRDRIPAKSCVAQPPGQADFHFMSFLIILMIKNV